MSQYLIQQLETMQGTLQQLVDGHDDVLQPNPKRDVKQIQQGVNIIYHHLMTNRHHPKFLEFLARAGHDMRGALHRVIGHSMLLSMYPDLYPNEHLSPEQQNQLADIYARADKLLPHINTVVMLAKMKTHQLQPIPQTIFSLHEVLVGALSVLEVEHLLHDADFPTVQCCGAQYHIQQGFEMLLYGLDAKLHQHPQIKLQGNHLLLCYPQAQDNFSQISPLFDASCSKPIHACQRDQMGIHAAVLLFRHYGVSIDLKPMRHQLQVEINLQMLTDGAQVEAIS